MDSISFCWISLIFIVFVMFQAKFCWCNMELKNSPWHANEYDCFAMFFSVLNHYVCVFHEIAFSSHADGHNSSSKPPAKESAWCFKPKVWANAAAQRQPYGVTFPSCQAQVAQPQPSPGEVLTRRLKRVCKLGWIRVGRWCEVTEV